MEKAFWMRSSRLQAKAEAHGSIGYKSRVEADDGSTGGNHPDQGGFEATHSRLIRYSRSWS